jgi:hypothetical protein
MPIAMGCSPQRGIAINRQEFEPSSVDSRAEISDSLDHCVSVVPSRYLQRVWSNRCGEWTPARQQVNAQARITSGREKAPSVRVGAGRLILDGVKTP